MDVMGNGSACAEAVLSIPVGQSRLRLASDRAAKERLEEQLHRVGQEPGQSGGEAGCERTVDDSMIVRKRKGKNQARFEASGIPGRGYFVAGRLLGLGLDRRIDQIER